MMSKYTQPVSPPGFGQGGWDYGFNNTLNSGGATSNYGMAAPQIPYGGIGNPNANFLGNYGANAGAPSVGSNFNWGNAGNVMGAIQGGLGVYNNIMDLLGKSDADKQRKLGKTFTMREWNTKARMHDNQLQLNRNRTARWNAAHPDSAPNTTYDNLKSLGTWGNKPGRTLDG